MTQWKYDETMTNNNQHFVMTAKTPKGCRGTATMAICGSAENAKLIAAAPEMLALLQDFVAGFAPQSQADEILLANANQLLTKLEN